MNEQVDVDLIADIADDLAEHMVENEERQEMFRNFAEEGKEDLLAELELIEAEAVGGDVADLTVNADPIAAAAKPAPSAAARQAEE